MPAPLPVMPPRPEGARRDGPSGAMLLELVDVWTLWAEMEPDSKPGRRETLRECADVLRMLVDQARRL